MKTKPKTKRRTLPLPLPPPEREGKKSSAPLHVQLRLETTDTRPSLRRWLPRELARLAAVAGAGPGTLGVLVVDDSRMSELHQRHTGVGGTTDVLTFDLREDPGGPLEGDLVLCIDEARRQAAARGHAVRLEALLYALHGLLHLLGYDDHSARNAARMHQREDEVLRAAGFPPIYKTAIRKH